MSFTAFHLIRPWWFLALIPVLVVWRLTKRSSDPRTAYAESIAPHLLDELLGDREQDSWFRPLNVLFLFWVIAVVALAGPSWRAEKSPFADDEARLMIVLGLKKTMLASDIKPSRLERTRTKLYDLLDERKGASNGLVAYGGSAHLVMPFTNDPQVISHMLEALQPDVMPKEGDAVAEAITSASERITMSRQPGSILLVTDSVDSSQLELLKTWRAEQSTAIQIYAPLSSEEAASSNGVSAAAEALSCSVVLPTADESDITRIHRRVKTAVVAAELPEGSKPQDAGVLLLPLLVVLLALWGRKGWTT